MIAPNEEFARSALSNITAITKKFNILNRPRAKKVLFPAEGRDWRQDGKVPISKALYGAKPANTGKQRNLWRILGLPMLEIEIYTYRQSEAAPLMEKIRNAVQNLTVLLPAREMLHALGKASDEQLLKVVKALYRKLNSLADIWGSFNDRNEDIQDQFLGICSDTEYDSIYCTIDNWICNVYSDRPDVISRGCDTDDLSIMITTAICEKILNTKPNSLGNKKKPVYYNIIAKALGMIETTKTSVQVPTTE